MRFQRHVAGEARVPQRDQRLTQFPVALTGRDDLAGRGQRVLHLQVDQVGPQPQLEAGISAMEVAFRMQMEAPEVIDIGKESEAVRKRYGDHDFGRGCLMALRLAERGVRMVQIYFGNFQPWDSHDDIRVHRQLAQQADGPIAALVDDLK